MITHIGLRRVSDGPVVGHVDTHLGILGKVGIILDKSEGLVLKLNDEDAIELALAHAKSLVAIVGVLGCDSVSRMNKNEAGDDSKRSLHGWRWE